MTYQETISWLFQQLPQYQRVGGAAYKANLDNIERLAKRLDHPEKKFRSIHVAGTNGKGSTSHMLASILQEAGYKVGLYTSPHLTDFRERIRINGKMIPKRKVVEFINENGDFFSEHPCSFFEMTVGLAFDHFSKEQVDIAVIEVGLGGRLDSTNIITPEVSVITNIGKDHMQFLGNSLAEIAREKAGIIKEEIPVIIGETTEETLSVFEEIARIKNAKLRLVNRSSALSYTSDLKGNYQLANMRLTVATVEELRQIGWNIEEIAVREGLLKVVENTGLQGRWQVLQKSPMVVCDTAHNKEGLQIVLPQLLSLSYRKLHIVLGVVKDKSLDDILPLFPDSAIYYFCQPAVERGLEADSLASAAHRRGLRGIEHSSVNQAFKAALSDADAEDVIFIGGSTFVVAEVL
jgi:dihydrofolate synthase / folylpolyglutamate synthase